MYYMRVYKLMNAKEKCEQQDLPLQLDVSFLSEHGDSAEQVCACGILCSFVHLS